MRVSAVVALIAIATTADDTHIAAALLPLPPFMRDSAAVVELDSGFRPQVLRRGTNGMVCIADRAGDADFNVRCYREDSIAVVYRGFQLRHEGLRGKAIGVRIEAEIKSGALGMTRAPTAGYRCLGPIAAFDTVKIAVAPPIAAGSRYISPIERRATSACPKKGRSPTARTTARRS